MSVFAFFLIAFVSGNNLAVCAGSIISSKMVKKRTGVVIAVLGYIVGFLFEGDLLRSGLTQILPTPTSVFILTAMGIAIVVFIIAHFLRVPQSLSITFTMSLLGIAMASGQQISWRFVAIMIGFWVVAVVASITLTSISILFSADVLRKRRIWPTIKKMKYLLAVLSFLTAFTLGANTIGLVYASIPKTIYNTIMVIIAILLGGFLLSGGELRRISDEILPLRYLNALTSQAVSIILVEIATLFSMPLSNIQSFIASLYGAELSYKTRLMLMKPPLIILATWILTAFASFGLGYLITILVR